ncbi:YceI family protein [Undibacterium fentianense]|uniref:Polyisoprenoid-binding protein n=1 Tax=Undibacterium fentianense TaxID=2828728 RepID=A0A941DZD4_9BURK|nr:YceI family protein [Undibacterium fentianense]MBR7799600.1 polyisoprenoid-binding protein [Undibacterium fentianense]
MKLNQLIAIGLFAVAAPSFAQTYKIDPSHTYPSFEADHKGISFWRGKFTKTEGTITLDRAAKTGTMSITIDANSIDFGHQKMNDHAKNKDMFNAPQFPTITYVGKSMKFDGDRLVSVDGELTLLGVTKPVALTVNKFKCIQDAMTKAEICGADASAEFKRSDFGMNFALNWGFSPDVKLSIQVEAVKSN